MDDAVWDATMFTKSRERRLANDVARAFLEQVVTEARARSNATHASKTNPEARLAWQGKGQEATLCHQGHALMDNVMGSSSMASSRRPREPPSARRQ